MEEQAEIKRIQLIVHPAFYYAGYRNLPQYQEHYIAHIQHDFHNYGQMVLEAASRKDTLVLIVPTEVQPTVQNRIRKILTRFNQFAHKRLGTNFIELPTEVGYLSERSPKCGPLMKLIRERLQQIRFANQVVITPSGQFRKLCTTVTVGRLTSILAERGITSLLAPHRNSLTQKELAQLGRSTRKEFFNRLRKLKQREYGKRNPAQKRKVA